MHHLSRIIWLVLLAGCWGPVHAVPPAVYATITMDVSTIQLKEVVQGCPIVASVYPTSAITTYYADSTYQEDYVINGNPVTNYGTWGFINDARKTIHMDYTGNPGDRTGTWGAILSGIETAAQASCGSVVTLNGATIRVKQQTMVLTVSAATALVGSCSGAAKVTYQLEGYGTNTGTGLPVKITRQITSRGVATLGPGGGC